MLPTKQSVKDFFQSERRYSVPLYQRSYVWKQETQWEPLWADVEREARRARASQENRQTVAHFLGAVVLDVSRVVGNGVAQSAIIDGQQRLTTLQLMIAAIRDVAFLIDPEKAKRFSRLVFNPEEYSNPMDKLKIAHSRADRDVFETTMHAKSPDDLIHIFGVASHVELPLIGRCYCYFYDMVSNFVNENEDKQTSQGRLDDLSYALSASLQFVKIELEDSDDPQVIFETLNARGQPLLPSDLIKNYLFQYTARDQGVSDDYLYQKYWSKFDLEDPTNTTGGDTRFWYAEIHQGTVKRPRIDLFIYHYLIMKTGKEINIGRLFNEFKDWFQRQDSSVDELLADMTSYLPTYRKILEPEEPDRLYTLAMSLNALNMSTMHPLLMYIASRAPDTPCDAAKISVLEDLESYIVRRFVCRLTTKNYNSTFLQLLRVAQETSTELEKPNNNAQFSAISAELRFFDDVSNIWPNNSMFRTAWLSKAVYVKSNPARSKNLLIRIEAAMRTARNEIIQLDRGLTVEHLLPQNPTPDAYESADMTLAIDDETEQQFRKRHINTIGNLTLLTQSLNASIGAGPFSEKSQAIAEDSDLRLNAWMRNEPHNRWTDIMIRQRGLELFAYAEQLWPSPDRNEVAQQNAA